MKTVAARDAKNRFGELLDTVQREPVTIQKKGRPVAVVVSLEKYRCFEDLEDAAWATRADAAAGKGFIGTEESQALLQDLLNAEA